MSVMGDIGRNLEALNGDIYKLELEILNLYKHIDQIIDEMTQKKKNLENVKRDIEDKWLNIYESKKKSPDKITKEYASKQAQKEYEQMTEIVQNQISELETQKRSIERLIQEKRIERDFLIRKFDILLNAVKVSK